LVSSLPHANVSGLLSFVAHVLHFDFVFRFTGCKRTTLHYTTFSFTSKPVRQMDMQLLSILNFSIVYGHLRQGQSIHIQFSLGFLSTLLILRQWMFRLFWYIHTNVYYSCYKWIYSGISRQRRIWNRNSSNSMKETQIQVAVFWVVTPCRVLVRHQRFRASYW